MSSRHVSRATQEAEHAVRQIQSSSQGNQYCADCGITHPEYINFTIGTFICESCAHIHRNSSNRRIKHMFSDDLTMHDVRRMETVGNDVANRKFLATWNPQEFPEPDRRDKDALHEFLWLKYEGNFKQSAAAPPNSQPSPSYSSQSSSYYDDRRDHRSRAPDRGYRREQQLFRGPPQKNPDNARTQSYWSSRFAGPARPQDPLPPPPPRPMRADDYYRRGDPSVQHLPDRYRSNAHADRFQPPQPAPIAPYDLARSARARYPEPGYDEYATRAPHDRDRRYAPGRSRGYDDRPPTVYSDDDFEDDRSSRKKKPSKSKKKVKGKSTKYQDDVDQDDYYSEEDKDETDVVGKRSKKSQSSKSKKASSKVTRRGSSSRRKTEAEEESDDTESSSSESEDDYEVEKERKKSKRKNKSGKRGDREVDSVKSLEDGTVPSVPTAANGKGEFDMMSDWMGDSKDTEESQSGAQTQSVPPNILANAMQQAYQTAQMPMMPPPGMSMYNSVMPLPGGGFMPMMTPGFVPGMPMPNMHGMPPMMPAGVGGMPGAPGMAGLVNGMHGMNMNQGVPNGAGQGSAAPPPPPPPPPLGVPAGPPPGPPPGAPRE